VAESRPSNRKVLVLPGDGIGPEIMREVLRVVEFFDRGRIASFEISEDMVGGAAYDAYGTPLDDATLAKALASDAVLFGSVGGPKWETLPFELQPERGLLRLRKEMDLFANLRPAVVFDALADASSLKRELVVDLDLMIVRNSPAASISASRAGSRPWPTAPAAASTPKSIARPRSSASPASPSNWRGGAEAMSARSTRPMSWSRVSCGARWRGACMPTTPMSNSASCTPTTARCSSCATQSSST